jgi:signal transduction histidine kinase/ligand-binding sensor domain-containing protein
MALLALVAAWLLLAAPVCAYEPELHFSVVGPEQGLAQASGNALIHDHRGFLWIGTQDGLARFDGHRAKLFRRIADDPSGLADGNILALAEAPAGTLWVGTWSAGLHRYTMADGRFSRVAMAADGQPMRDGVRALASDPRGRVWVGTARGLLRLDLADPLLQVETLVPSPGRGHDGVLALHVSAAGDVLVGTDTGLHRRDAASGRFVRVDLPAADDVPVTALASDGQGVIWIGTMGRGLWTWTISDPQASPAPLGQVPPELAAARIMALAVDRRGALWVGTQGSGLLLREAGKAGFRRIAHAVGDRTGLVNDIVLALAPTPEGGIWVGTQGGINGHDPRRRRFGHYRHRTDDPESLSHDWVRGFLEDRRGHIWVATQGGLNRWDADARRFVRFHFSESGLGRGDDAFWALAEDADGRFWLGGLQGILSFDPSSGVFHTPTWPAALQTLFARARINKLLLERDGTLWVGTREEGLLRIAADRRQFRQYRFRADDPESLSHDLVRDVLRTRDGELWVATWGGGACRLDEAGERFHCLRHADDDPHTLGHDAVAALFEDSAGRFWMATHGGGLALVDRQSGRVQRIGEEQGMANLALYGVLEDQLGRLWVSHNAGLSYFTPPEGRFHNIGEAEGLQANEFNNGAYFRSSTGEFFFGGVRGFNRFDPALAATAPPPPRVVLTDLLLANRPVPLAHQDSSDRFRLPRPFDSLDTLALGPGEDVFSIEFAALEMANPAGVRYRYRLHGFDRDWIETDVLHRRATYTGLDPGRYRFEVQAALEGAAWSAPAALAIEIAPPWYATAPAQVLWLGLVVALAWLLLRWRLNHLRARHRTLEQQVAERTRQLTSLAEIGRELTATLDLDGALESLYKAVHQLLDADVFGIGLCHPERNEIEFRLAIESGVRYRPYSRRMDDPSQLATRCLQSGQPLLVDDFPRRFPDLQAMGTHREGQLLDGRQPGQPRAMVYVPMLLKSTPIGVVCVQSYRADAFQAADVELLQSLAAYATIAIDNSRQLGALQASQRSLLDTQQQLVLREKMAALGTLTAGVAHEINNPTNFADGAVQNLLVELAALHEFLHRLAGEDADPGVLAAIDERLRRLQDMGAIAREGHERIKRIVADLRQLTRLDEAAFKRIRLSEPIRSTVNLVRTRFDRVDFDLDLALDPEIDCHPAKLGQVFMNLIVNACQAVQDTGRPGWVRIGIALTDTNAVVHIVDNGNGMDTATRDRLFEPFFTTKPVGQGTGLGLSLSLGIVREHGGDISVQSMPGVGTRFQVVLPLPKPAGRDT